MEIGRRLSATILGVCSFVGFVVTIRLNVNHGIQTVMVGLITTCFGIALGKAE